MCYNTLIITQRRLVEMGRINANNRMWDIIERCREGRTEHFGGFHGEKLITVSDYVTSVHSERSGGKYVRGTVEFNDISVAYNVNYGTFKVDGVATFDNEFVKFGREVLLKVFG